MPTKTDDTWTLAEAEVLWDSAEGDFQSLAYATAGKAASAMLSVGSTTLEAALSITDLYDIQATGAAFRIVQGPTPRKVVYVA